MVALYSSRTADLPLVKVDISMWPWVGERREERNVPPSILLPTRNVFPSLSLVFRWSKDSSFTQVKTGNDF